jgi:protein subunit release factor A
VKLLSESIETMTRVTAKLAAKPMMTPSTTSDTPSSATRRTSRSGGLPSAHEFAEHQQDIADTKAMQNQAKDPQLKQLLGNELPALQKQLEAAEKLLGDTPGGSAAWHNAEFRKTERAKSAKSRP